MRRLSYVKAINEALHQLMEEDERVTVLGVGVNSPWYVGQSCIGLAEKFGDWRVIDIPVSENGITGIAIGGALSGLRPVMTHPRMDFMYLAFDQIINHAASWHYMLGGRVSVPVTVRGIINRGGEQGAQHSQALQGLFAHIPGLKVVMPATPYDAKGLMVASVRDENPVIYIDDRWLYEEEGEVPEDLYEVPIGEAAVRLVGKDVTIAATSYMVKLALAAAAELSRLGIESEVIDLRSVKPLDRDAIVGSVRKTGRLVVADAAWRSCGVAAEVAAVAVEEAFEDLRAPIRRVTLPDAPAPMSSVLEKAYYPSADAIAAAVNDLMRDTGVKTASRKSRVGPPVDAG